MAAPALAVAGGSEEAVDHLFIGCGGLVGEEGLEVLFGGREAGEIEGGAAEEGGFIGLRGGFQGVLFEGGKDELVER